MVGWHHWCNGQELGQTSGYGAGQGSLACCSTRGREKSDTTGRLNNNTHHYSITQSSLFSLKTLCAPTHPSLSPVPSNHLSFYCPHNFCLFWNVIQYVAFSDWLLSLGNMQLCFLHVFSWFGNSFHFMKHWIMFYSLDVPQYIYSFIYSRTSWLLLIFGHYD